jgi:signal peptidase I
MSKKMTDEKNGSKIKKDLKETFNVIWQSLLLAVLIHTIFFKPFSIPSGSMRPTLLQSDYLFVSKFSYGYSKYSLPFAPNLFEGRILAKEPKRGDVVVFKFPPNPDLDYIKRLIGLPGDKIQVKDSLLYINDQPVKREKTRQINDYDVTHENGPVDVFKETLPNGVSYETLDLGLTDGDETREFIVPVGHYFMMGDNRDSSADSRFAVGFVPFDHLVGRATLIYFSIAGEHSPLELWQWPNQLRFSRFLSWIR